MANGTAPTYRLRRCRLADGERTTLYVVRHALAAVRPRVHVFPSRGAWTTGAGAAACARRSSAASTCATRSGRWARSRVDGEVVPGTRSRPSTIRARPAFHAVDGRVAIAPRGRLPGTPAATSCRRGRCSSTTARVVYDDHADAEGFSAGAGQFDSDITDGRHPRAAIGLDDRHVWLLACDGRRSGVDAGLRMLELAELMAELGCRVAMNLDGGGSTTLVHHGHLLNRPYSEQDQPAPASRPIVTALVLEAR